jgi:hypothetical protein
VILQIQSRLGHNLSSKSTNDRPMTCCNTVHHRFERRGHTKPFRIVREIIRLCIGAVLSWYDQRHKLKKGADKIELENAAFLSEQQ